MKKTLLLSYALAVAVSSATAQVVVFDDFEAGEGRFNLAPDFSGSTTGEAATSTADHDATGGVFGSTGSQVIFLDDDTGVDQGPFSDFTQTFAWRLRHLSGGGSQGNNVGFASDGSIGYYLKTTTPNLFASIGIDDGNPGPIEMGSLVPIIADGLWHVYQWDLNNANDWSPFALTGMNGQIDAGTVFIDSLFVLAEKTSGDQDATFSIDNVSHNPTGMLLPVPEPSTVTLGVLGGVGCLVGYLRRRRA